ncbi:hypothetical protein T484DRAFT_1755860 [Baffinella frigidus]|nr:hypothetical protein T484DRAFT_1755860 [Cryptophyta sp. CCMP2293]
MRETGRGMYTTDYPCLSPRRYKSFLEIVGADHITDAANLQKLLCASTYLAVQDTGNVLQTIIGRCRLVATHGSGFILEGFADHLGIFPFDIMFKDWLIIGPGNAQRPKPESAAAVSVALLKKTLTDRLYPSVSAGDTGIWQVVMCDYTDSGPKRPIPSREEVDRITQHITTLLQDKPPSEPDESLYCDDVHRAFDVGTWLSITDADNIKDFSTLHRLLLDGTYLAFLVTGERFPDNVIFNIESNWNGVDRCRTG